MYKLYVANKNYSSWSLRPWILLKVLEIPFEELMQPFPDTNVWESFRQFSPSGKVPCLVADDMTVWDSLGIVEFLAEKHEDIWPKDFKARTWARCATAEMHSGFQALRNQCSMNCGLRVDLKTIDKDLQKDLKRLEEIWKEGLETFGGLYLAGSQFTAVDAFFAPVVFRIQTYNLPLPKFLKDYTQRILNLDDMKSWYEAALAETWRDNSHEAEIALWGKIVNDNRLQG